MIVLLIIVMAIISISGSGIVWEAVLEKEIFEFCKSIFAISWLYSLEKGVALHLNKLDSFHPKMLCAKFGWIWSGGSTRCRLIEWLFGGFTPYRQYFSHETAAEFEKLWKMWKVYRRADKQTTDNRRSEKLIWAFSSGELNTQAPLLLNSPFWRAVPYWK